MIQNYLQKLQEMQRDLLGSGINIQIQNRYDSEENYSWLVITVTAETDSDFVPGENYMSVHMYGGMHKNEEANEKHQAEAYAKVENFVKKLLTFGREKERFMKAYERALAVQRACLYSKVSVEVQTTFCKSLFNSNNADAWTLSLGVWIEKDGEDERSYNSARWDAWHEDASYYGAVEDIESELEKEGIIVNK